MKKIKKLSVVIVALAICMVFTGTVWAVGTDAADEISFVATPSAATLHVSDQPQTVTVTIDASSALSVYGTQGVVVVTGDLEYTIEHFVPLNEADVNYKDGTFAWFDAEVEAQTISKTLLTITVTIPANKTGSFMIGLSDLLYVTGFDEEAGDVAEVSKTDIYTTLTISDHAHKAYGKDADNHWSVCACGEVVPNTTKPHDFTSGDCACGAEKPAEPTGLKGDVNGDGSIDMEDFTLIARHVGELEFITDSTAFSNADVNDDGEVDMEDFTLVARHVGELEFINN